MCASFKFVLLIIGVLGCFGVTSQGVAASESRTSLERLIIYVPASEGGGFDSTGAAVRRALLKEGLVDSVDIVRSPGAGGLIGLAQFLEANHDVPTVFLGGRTLVGSAIYNRSNISLQNLAPVARLNNVSIAIVVSADSPIRNILDLTSVIQSDPDIVQWAGGSRGGTDQLLIQDIYLALGLREDSVNYSASPGGGYPVIEDLLTNERTAAVGTPEEFDLAVQDGRLRYLAVSTEAPIESIDAPTLIQSGLDIQLGDWRGILASPSLDSNQLSELELLFEDLATSEAWASELSANNWRDYYANASEFAIFLESENAVFAARRDRDQNHLSSNSQLGRLFGRQTRWAFFAISISALLAAALFVQRTISSHRQHVLEADLSDAREEMARALAELEAAPVGASAHIERKFAEWELSSAEREVGWMLLKGLALKEIGIARGTSERTIRQQARSIYTKSGLSNRSNLSAYFLEDFWSGVTQEADS